MSGQVAIVIVSHSRDVARSVAALVRDTVSGSTPVAWSGGTEHGGLGTEVGGILAAIRSVYTPAGVAVLVDLGGAETNAEMAIELMPEERRSRIVICNAPVVEGAVMAATEASGGGSLADVKRTAEELSPQ